MLSKKQILHKIHSIKKNGNQYCVAIKVVEGVNDATDASAENGKELRITPINIDTDELYDYTIRFCKVMINPDGREIVPFSTDHLSYLAIIGADTEEEGNAKIKAAIADYSKAHGYGKVMSEDELKTTVTECVEEYKATQENDESPAN